MFFLRVRILKVVCIFTDRDFACSVMVIFGTILCISFIATYTHESESSSPKTIDKPNQPSTNPISSPTTY